MNAAAPNSPAPVHDGRLHSRATLFHDRTMAALALPAGIHKLAFPDQRQALLYIPEPSGQPLPLLVLLHGARGQHGGADAAALRYAVREQALLLIPEARGTSWDMFRGGYGPDLDFLDQSLMWVMRRHPVDAAAITLAGFSDGASYALSVGLMNGELFSDILAFSPGCMLPNARSAMPRIFIGHGSGDAVLPVERGQSLAHQLAHEGYQVHYAEFEGGHTVPAAIAEAAFALIGQHEAETEADASAPPA